MHLFKLSDMTRKTLALNRILHAMDGNNMPQYLEIPESMVVFPLAGPGLLDQAVS